MHKIEITNKLLNNKDWKREKQIVKKRKGRRFKNRVKNIMRKLRKNFDKDITFKETKTQLLIQMKDRA